MAVEKVKVIELKTTISEQRERVNTVDTTIAEVKQVAEVEKEKLATTI